MKLSPQDNYIGPRKQEEETRKKLEGHFVIRKELLTNEQKEQVGNNKQR